MKYGAKNHELRTQANDSRLNPDLNPADARIVAAIRKISDEGTVFHVLASTPSQNVDCYSVLIDQSLVVDFELKRDEGAPQPLEVEIQTVSQFRTRVGQKGSHRLDATLEVARRVLSTIH